MTAMPAQKPGKSEQDVTTPWKLIDAVERRFGAIDFDLAATCDNDRVRLSKGYERGNANLCLHFGPGSSRGENSLDQDWTKLSGNLWLNPPFGKTSEAPRGIVHWARKCCESKGAGRMIYLLVPAATGAKWFADYVWGRSQVQLLEGRVRFVGHVNDYPKDLLLAVYGAMSVGASFERVQLWDWRAAT